MLPYFREVLGAPEDGALYSFDPAMMYVLDPAAIETDDMVMLGDIRKFVMGVIVTEVDRLDHPFLFQRFQRSVDSGMVRATGECVDDILSAYWIFVLFKNFKNSNSGRGRFVAAFSQYVPKIIFLGHLPIISKRELLATNLPWKHAAVILGRMRIAFVGKGGSGKTTLSALFAEYINKKYPVIAIDADLNMHLGGLLGAVTLPIEKHISHPEAAKVIKTHLKGKNARIKDLAQFRKTTPPTAESNLIYLDDSEDPILVKFGSGDKNLRLLVVGTYDSEEIGASCYHNNLAILENILSHLVDSSGVVVTDMVAGVDAFANTLHAQFDLLVLTVEPTKRGLEVFEQYRKLAEEAGVYDSLFVIGNKVRSEADAEFIKKHVPAEKLVGLFKESEYLRQKDQEGGALNVDLLEDENKALLETIEKKLFSVTPDNQKRLQKLYELHRRYVAQGFIAERYGDITDQIDETFNFDDHAKRHTKNPTSS